MKLYIHKSPFTGKKRLVIESNILLAHNRRSRGAALGWIILHKIPVYGEWDGKMFSVNGDGYYVCSDSGCKRIERVLNHEHWHCDSQTCVIEGDPKNYEKRKVPFWRQVPNVIKWMYKYKKDKTFHEEEERLARQAEHV